MNLQKLIFVNNDCYKKGKKMTPKGIMVHSTGANNPNLCRYVGPDDGKLGKNKYNNHWNQSGHEKCVHAFIGKLADGSIATYQTLPWNYEGWHSGSYSNSYISKSANKNGYIGFEICEDDKTDASYLTLVYNEAVELCAYLCKEYKLDPLADGVIISHKEGHDRKMASNHGDPDYWFKKHGMSMDNFRKAVKAKMGGAIESTPAPAPTSKVIATKQVNTPGDTLNVRSGASHTAKKLGQLKHGSKVDVYEKATNGWMRIKQDKLTGWVNGGFLIDVTKEYKVKITANSLNVRSGAGTNYKVNCTVHKDEVYTIVEEVMNDTTKWGKLKSGEGWISLNTKYSKKV